MITALNTSALAGQFKRWPCWPLPRETAERNQDRYQYLLTCVPRPNYVRTGIDFVKSVRY
jgi:hypothetical protein